MMHSYTHNPLDRFGPTTVYLHGLIEEEEGDADLEEIVHGPFFSWIDTSGKMKNVSHEI